MLLYLGLRGKRGGSMTFILRDTDQFTALVVFGRGATRCAIFVATSLWYLRFSDRLFRVFFTEIEIPGRTLYDKL